MSTLLPVISLGTPGTLDDTSWPALGVDAQGCIFLFVVDTSGAVFYKYQEIVPPVGPPASLDTAANWSNWVALPGQTIKIGTRLTAASNQDGRLEIFGFAPDGTLVHNWQIVPGSNQGWAGWQSLPGVQCPCTRGGGPPARGWPAVAQNQDGRLEVFVWNTPSPQWIWHIWQVQPNGGWSSWGAISDSSDDNGILQPAVALDSTGKLSLIGRSGQVIGDPYNNNYPLFSQRGQSAPNNGWVRWFLLNPWSSVPQHGVGDLALAANQDGHLEVFTVVDGELSHLWQSPRAGQPGFFWTNPVQWQPFQALPSGVKLIAPRPPLPAVSTPQNPTGLATNVVPAVALNGRGQLEVFLPAQNGIWTISQSSPNVDPWNAWKQLNAGQACQSNLSAIKAADGTVRVFGVVASEVVYAGVQYP